MRKYQIALFLILLFQVGALMSCKKDSSTAQSNVEYQIVPMNANFTSITYRDNTGSNVTIADPADFTSGSKTITVSSRPFTAELGTTIVNNSTESVNYTLLIKVDGEIKASTPVNAPPYATKSDVVSFTLE